MDQKLIAFNLSQRRTDLPVIRQGDVVRVHRKIKEGDKERTQVFTGMIIALKGGQSASPTMTVRKTSFGVGVEIVLPFNALQVEKVELVKRTRTRRAKLYYVRDKSAKVLSKKLREVAVKGAPIVRASETIAPAEIVAGEPEAPEGPIESPAEETKQE